VTARVTWLGHSTVRIELGGLRLLTDPLLRSRVFHLRRHGAAPGDPGPVDAVLLSHLHHDHLDLASLHKLEPQPRIVCPTGSGALLANAGFGDLYELLPGESVALPGARVEATAAVHSGRRWPRGAPIQPLGFVVRGERSVYFAGDTDLFEGMAALGPVDVALLPVAGYSPKLGPGHLDARRAAEAAARVRARVAVPIHWGTLAALGRPRGRWFTDPPADFAAYAADWGVDVRVLSLGESLEL
jgi:L-ascorbate metabolism protein UlaG (beta-lactamase superfamily)